MKPTAAFLALLLTATAQAWSLDLYEGCHGCGLKTLHLNGKYRGCYPLDTEYNFPVAVVHFSGESSAFRDSHQYTIYSETDCVVTGKSKQFTSSKKTRTLKEPFVVKSYRLRG
jgi:hypothetical protein